MSRSTLSLLVCSAAALSVSCAARLRSGEVTGVSQGARVDGIPFRLRESYDVTVYKLKGPDDYKPVFRTMKTLPDMDHVYVLGIDAGGLSDHTLGVTINPDGTLKVIDLATELRGDDVLAALGPKVTEVSNAIAGAEATRLAQEQANAAAKAALLTAEDSTETARRSRLTTQLERERQALAETQNADRAIETLARMRTQTVPTTPTAEQIAEQERIVVAAKRLANDKARVAGTPVPFP